MRYEWTEVERQRSAAFAAHLFMNMRPCPDCGLPWPEGLVHDRCEYWQSVGEDRLLTAAEREAQDPDGHVA
jgi:hypothetical protein